MPGPMHSLHRAVAELTVGVAKGLQAREQRNLEMGLTEIQLQHRVPISGTAGLLWGFGSTTIEFDFPFFHAPGQRDPDFEQPQFWYGVEVNQPIAVTAAIAGWAADSGNGAIIGATVRIGVQAALIVPYTGVVHLTFQGFSALSEAETDVTE